MHDSRKAGKLESALCESLLGGCVSDLPICAEAILASPAMNAQA